MNIQGDYELTEKGILLHGGYGTLDVPVELDLSVIGRRDSAEVRRELSRRAVQIISETSRLEDDFSDDRAPLGVLMSDEPLGDSDRLGMVAKLRLPDAHDGVASQEASRVMRRTARQVRLFDDGELLDTMVYATVSRTDGITLETNPAGSCAINTSGVDYGPDREVHERVTLQHHNLYTYEMQLVCLSGLISLARMH